MQQFTPWPRYAAATKGFALLYGAITKELRTYAASLDRAHERWLNGLIDEFDSAFRAWEYDPRLRLALERIDRASPVAFQVTAHAYIHIAYDLPRCIATYLHPQHRPPGQGARDAYFQARGILLETFDRACLNRQVFGWYSVLFRVLHSIPVVRDFPFGIWASDVRERSFSIAEQLLVSTGREADEVRLWRDVERRLKYAGKRGNPFAWLDILSPPDLPDPANRLDVLDVITPIGFCSAAEITYSDEPPEDPDDGPSPPKEGPNRQL